MNEIRSREVKNIIDSIIRDADRPPTIRGGEQVRTELTRKPDGTTIHVHETTRVWEITW